MTDASVAAALARGAGELLLKIRGSSGLAGQALKDEGDKRSHELLVAELARVRPDDAVRSEEAGDGPERVRARRVWIIDPLDGTREFSEPPRRDWAVHVALWADGDLAAGAVALPADEVVLDSDAPPRPPTRREARLRLLVSRTRAPRLAVQVAEQLGAELVPMGSAGAKIAAVIRGEADAYVHAGGQYEWDTAAPVAVARAAGLHACRLDGSPLRYNQSDPWQPDIVVCRPDVRAPLMAALGRAAPPGTPEAERR